MDQVALQRFLFVIFVYHRTFTAPARNPKAKGLIMTNTAYDEQPGTAIFHAYGTRFNYLTSSDQSIAWVVTGWDQQSHGAGPNNNTAGRCDDDCSIPGTCTGNDCDRFWISYIQNPREGKRRRRQRRKKKKKRMRKQRRETAKLARSLNHEPPPPPPPPTNYCMTRWPRPDQISQQPIAIVPQSGIAKRTHLPLAHSLGSTDGSRSRGADISEQL